jgi:hypothetical protein
VVVGGGYIGLELAEACQVRGLDVTVVNRSPTPIGTFDPDIGRFIADAVANMGIRLVFGEPAVAGRDGSGRARQRGAHRDGSGCRPTWCARPRRAPERRARAGGRHPARRLRRHPGGQPDAHRRAGRLVRRRLRGELAPAVRPAHGRRAGTHANKQGRVIGINLGGGYAIFPGVIGPRSPRSATWRWRAPGLSEAEADAAGYCYVTAHVDSTTRAGYFPGATDDPGQAAGREAQRQAARRADRRAGGVRPSGSTRSRRDLERDERRRGARASTCRTRPPFAPVWDPVLIAARKAFEAVEADIAATCATSG